MCVCVCVLYRSVRHAKSLCYDVEMGAEDATRADRHFLRHLLRVAIDAGATSFNVPDTVGCCTPQEMGELISFLFDAVGGDEGVILSVHTHNDLGMATANALAAVEAGARQVECCVSGIGERAGNAALEEVVMALHTCEAQIASRTGQKLYTGVDTHELLYTSQLLAELSGVPVPPNKAIVGENAFKHASGIHQSAVLKNPSTYSVFDPSLIGRREGHSIVISKHSGRAALRSKLENLGYPVDATMRDKHFDVVCNFRGFLDFPGTLM